MHLVTTALILVNHIPVHCIRDSMLVITVQICANGKRSCDSSPPVTSNTTAIVVAGARSHVESEKKKIKCLKPQNSHYNPKPEP